MRAEARQLWWHLSVLQEQHSPEPCFGAYEVSSPPRSKLIGDVPAIVEGTPHRGQGRHEGLCRVCPTFYTSCNLAS
jgi:hypothetical protein